MRAVRNLPLAIVLIVTLASAALTIAAPPYVWVDTLFDDAYYYLGVARHISLGDGSRFTFPLETNGYQPLWLLILTVLSLLVGADRALLAASTHLAILSVVLAFIFISWRQDGRAWPAALTSICFPMVILQGMETVLIPPLALLYFRSDGWKRGGLASLIFLSRLDALGLVLGRELYELAVSRRFDFRANAVLVTTMLLYAAVNLYLFGIPVPVSGLAKSLGNVTGENWPTGVRLVLGAAPVLLTLALAWTAQRRFRNPLPIFAAAFALVCSAIYYGVFSGWPTWNWYLWPAALLFYFVLIELIHCDAALQRNAAAIWLAVMFIPGPYFCFERLMPPQAGNLSWGQANASMAAMINSSPAATATFAMGDRAGSFGYLLADRFRVIQTEGLVGNVAYLDALKHNGGVRFLDAARTDYFVSDRDRYWVDQGTLAIPEPIQGLSARTGVMLICFPVDAEIRGFQLRPERKLFRYAQRVTCPAPTVRLFNRLMQQYGGIASSSLEPPPPRLFPSVN